MARKDVFDTTVATVALVAIATGGRAVVSRGRLRRIGGAVAVVIGSSLLLAVVAMRELDEEV